ncbi:MAG: NERD domain-containing protein [Bacteroidetes bacterium]|nr:NERD domain-containing protein [Bacteroidota bacterium]
MCKVYNQVGCLTVIKSHLRDHNLNEYRSVNELIAFQKNYFTTREHIHSHHRILIEQEKNKLGHEVIQLDQAIIIGKNEAKQQLVSKLELLENRLYDLSNPNPNFARSVVNFVKRTNLKVKIKNDKRTLNSKVEDSVRHLAEEYNVKHKRHEYILSDFENAVSESSFSQLQELDRRKRIIDELNNAIYGAQGEQKVVKELEKLSDDHILINDFALNFQDPIYNQQERDYIYSIQIDHILIAQSGVFLIETKNWSQQSLENRSLHSPVHQIKRTNFVLYKILKGEIFEPGLSLKEHHWGNRKIPIKNLIILINNKPTEEFEHVKVLTLSELLGYIRYFKPCFSIEETQTIADYLLSLQ